MEGGKKEVAVVGGDGEEVGGVRVLVVDDSQLDRKIVERMMLRSGLQFEVIAVDSGKKAMEVLGFKGDETEYPAVDGQKIDIILTDYCMPEMDGYGLLKAVKESSSLKYIADIPVVIMSSENDPQRISRCLASGAEDFILKPLQIADLQRLQSYVKPAAAPVPKAGTKRKRSMDVLTEGNESGRRPRLAGVAVA